MFSLFRLPLGAFSPNDVMYVFDRDGHVAGLLRAERDSPRDEWTVVELDAVGDLDAGDVRFRLVQHLLRDGGKRGAVRFHVACGDVDDNVELFMQAGFIRFGDEHVLFREPDDPLPAPMADDEARAARIRPAADLDARAAVAAVRDGHAGARSSGSRTSGSPTGSGRAGTGASRAARWRRSCGSPTSTRSSRRPRAAATTGRSSTRSSRSASRRRTSRTTSRCMARPEADVEPVIRYALGTIAARRGCRRAHRLGVLAPVRTYESPIDRRLEEEGFASIATVTLLMKETLVRVAEPRLVPAGVR